MYKRERIIIDTRRYTVDEIWERYKRGSLIFYKKNVMRMRGKATREVLDALARGIPFPPVYVSELQTGKLLVLDKSDRLRFLMEFLSLYNDDERFFESDIFYSVITLHVIDYLNPKYMHMQVGSFIEEWSVTQEQSIWNIIYQNVGLNVLDELSSGMYRSFGTKMLMQYHLLYYFMMKFFIQGKFDNPAFFNEDRYFLLEETIYEMKGLSYHVLLRLREQFEYDYNALNQRADRNARFEMKESENKMKWLCFISAWNEIQDEGSLDNMFHKNRMRTKILNCDMSYKGIDGILDDFK